MIPPLRCIPYKYARVNKICTNEINIFQKKLTEVQSKATHLYYNERVDIQSEKEFDTMNDLMKKEVLSLFQDTIATGGNAVSSEVLAKKLLTQLEGYFEERHPEHQYLDMLRHILENGTVKEDRTGTGTKSVFGYQMRFDLSKGFPLLTTKAVAFRLIVSELLWFIKGDTNIRYLLQHNNHIWDEWCIEQFIDSEEFGQVFPNYDMTNWKHRKDTDEDFKVMYKEVANYVVEQILEDDAFSEKFGSIGENGAYGANWRRFAGPNGKVVDQLSDVIALIKKNPDSRRQIVTAWNPAEIDNAALPPCHTLFQFYVVDGKLSCQLYQRSGDTFLGIPFNIASYSLLVHMIARECGLEVGEFVHTIGDAHIYTNHFDAVNEQLSREPKPFPTLWLNPEKTSVFDFDMSDIKVENYESHPRIAAPVAV